MNSTLDVSGAALKSTVDISGATTIDNTLAVNDDVTIVGDTITGKTQITGVQKLLAT